MVTTLKKVGLFGGSFNPAHEGHLYISQCAIEKLGLDEIWWLVSPRNPLKPETSLAPYQDRFKGAKALAKGNPIKVSDIEAEQGLQYSIDTVRHLKAAHSKTAFVWVMGADCFLELPTWKDWQAFMAEIPLAIFRREGFSEKALGGKAATTFAKNRMPEKDARNLMVTKAPAWVYIDVKPKLISSTEIRQRQKG